MIEESALSFTPASIRSDAAVWRHSCSPIRRSSALYFQPGFQPSLVQRENPAICGAFLEYRHGDSNPGFRRERAAS